MPFKTRPGVDKSIQINTLNYLPHSRYILALQRFRAAIAAGRPLKAYDDTTPGAKSMGCSWGLCSESPQDWPDAEDHTFPLDFQRSGRVTPLDLRDSQKCPLDKRAKPDLNGCFYTCRVFQANRQNPKPTQAQALALYDQLLQEKG